MHRTGLILVLTAALVIGTAFAAFPGLDPMISAWFYDPVERTFPARDSALLDTLRDASMWIVAALAIPAVVALAGRALLPGRTVIMPMRKAIFLLSTLALGPGIVANVVMKDNWGRPRPGHIAQFGGGERFHAWWDPRGPCPKNCSFVGGESSGAFWTMAPAALAPPHWRTLAYSGAIAFGVFVGAIRVAFGGHFASDILFSGIFTFLVIWLTHGLLFRWPTQTPSMEEAAWNPGAVGGGKRNPQ